MINLPIEVGDLVLGGRFKNKKIIVKEIGYDEYGSPTINGRGILKIRIPKLYQKLKESLDQRQVRVSLIKTDKGDWILYDDSKDQNIDGERFKTKDEARVYANDHAYKIINIQEDTMFKGQAHIEESEGKFFVVMETDSGKIPVINPYGYNTRQHAVSSAVYKGFQIIQENGMKPNDKIKIVLEFIKSQIGLTLTPDSDFSGIKKHRGKQYFNVILKQRVSESDEFNRLDRFCKTNGLLKIEPNGVNRVSIFFDDSILEKLNTFKENIMKKLRKEGSWDRTLKVKVKKEGDRYYNYLVKEDEEDECLTPVGFETKALAKHAAMTKGYIVDDKEYETETSEPIKPTKREKTPGTEKPKEEKLSKGTELKLEGLIRKVIKEEIKKKVPLKELDIDDPQLESELSEMAALSDEMDRVKAQLKELENRFKPLDDKFRQILEAMDETQVNFLRIKNLLVTIKRKGYDRVDYKYKEAYLALRNKVNTKMKKQMDDFLEFGETLSGDKIRKVTKVKSSLGVQRIEGKLREENFLTAGWTKLKNFFNKGLQMFNKRNQEISNDIDKLEKMVGT